MALCLYGKAATPNTEAMSSRQAAKFIGMSKSAIGDHRRGECICGDVEAPKPVTRTEAAPEWVGRSDVDSVRGGFASSKPRPVGSTYDHAAILAEHDLDASLWEVTSYRRSKWQRHDGEYLEAERLNVVPRKDAESGPASVDVAGITNHLRSWKPAARTAHAKDGEPVTMFVGWADWQLGKGEGDGTKGTTARVLESFEKTADRITKLQREGINIERLLIANMGDHTEAVTGHYTSQTYSVDLNQRDQLNLAIELNLTGIKTLAPLVKHTTYAACLCNHGQWQRLGGKQITDDADNSTGFIADTLKTVCNLHADLSHIDWVIPRDEMITTGTFSGVDVAMGHGHKVSGSEETWLGKQAMWLHATRDFRPSLWFLAHRHTASVTDYGPYHRIQCTTEDPGSKSFTDGTGKFSTRGTTTALIGKHNARRFSHYEVL